jgi:flavin-dependent dehydrogenase
VTIEDTFEVPADLASLDVQPYQKTAGDMVWENGGGVREGVEVRTGHLVASDGVESAWTWRIGVNGAKRQCIEVLHERAG